MGPRKAKELLEADEEQIKELERVNLDLKIANRSKNFLIERMHKERSGFIEQLVDANRKMGELETKLMQLDSSKET